MTHLEFTNTDLKKTIQVITKPSLLIDVIQFQTTNPNWATWFPNARITIKLICYDAEKKRVGEFTKPPLISLISPYMTQPISIFNHYPIRFDHDTFLFNDELATEFELEFELGGVRLGEDERCHLYCHILAHAKYRVMCGKKLIAYVFITDNHPSNQNQRAVTLAPIKTTKQSATMSEVEFLPHHNLLIEQGITNEAILEGFFSGGQLTCASHKWSYSAY